MCIDCWSDYEQNKVVNDKVLKAKELIDELYEYHGAGGNLHVVLDDWNIDLLEGCIGFIETECDLGQREIELRVYNHLITMSEDEIATALAIHEGFTTEQKSDSV